MSGRLSPLSLSFLAFAFLSAETIPRDFLIVSGI